MHYGIEVVTFGEFGDPRVVVQLALAAEAAGWEGLWVWDHVVFPYGAGDPWVMLSAAATVTQRLKLCVGVAPMPRYRPHLLARTLTALDILSEGRVVFGTGVGGVADEFSAFGEPGDAGIRAAMVDEGLDVLTQLWSGEPVTHAGAFYSVNGVTLVPVPVQRPRIPVWIGGGSAPARRRAARWDGWIIGTVDENCEVVLKPEALAQHLAYVRQHRTSDAPFEVAIDGITGPGESALPREYADAGATWWFEALFGLRGSLEEMLARVQAGPPG